MAVAEVKLNEDSILALGADEGDGEMQNGYSGDISQVKVTGLGGILKMMGKKMLANMTLDSWFAQPNVQSAIL